jgi:hypothetical protein
MDDGKVSTPDLEKKSFDVVRLLAAFVGMFVLAWVLQYPAYFVVELIHQLANAIGGVLYRGDLAGYSLVPDLIPWHLVGGVTVTKGDDVPGRILAGPLASFFLFPLLVAIMFTIVGWLKPKTLGRHLLADFLELVAFWAGYSMFREARLAADSAAIMAVVNKENSTFITVFNGLLVLVMVIGLAVMVFYILKWLADLIANMGLAKKSDIWRPYVVGLIALIAGVIMYFVPKGLILDYIPYVMFLALGLLLFSRAGFPGKEEPTAPQKT